MKTRDAIEYFGGTRRLAEVLGIWPHNISRWGDQVPKSRAYELHVKTNGKLRVEDDTKNEK